MTNHVALQYVTRILFCVLLKVISNSAMGPCPKHTNDGPRIHPKGFPSSKRGPRSWEGHVQIHFRCPKTDQFERCKYALESRKRKIRITHTFVNSKCLPETSRDGVYFPGKP